MNPLKFIFGIIFAAILLIIFLIIGVIVGLIMGFIAWNVIAERVLNDMKAKKEQKVK